VAWLYVQARERGAILIPQEATHPLPVRNPTAWLAAAFFACNNFIFYSCISWLAPIYVELGRASTTAELLLGTFTFAFIVASPLFGFISRNEDRRICLGASSGIAFVGIIWVAVTPTMLPFAAVSLIAFGTGGAFTLSMTLPLDNARTHEEAAAWNAFVILISYLAGAAGPVLVGMLRDLNGGFYVSLWVLAGVGATMLAVTPFLRPSFHRPESL
jgi:CP family cyanate transporter-like MFS transporter